MAYYYKRIRELREDNDKTQQQIADLIKVKLTTYRRWELGERTIPTNYVVVLADFYNVSADYILGRTDNPKMNTNINKQVNITNNKESNTTINM